MPDPIGASEVAVTDKATKVIVSPNEEITRTVRNISGGQSVTLSRDSGIVSGKGFKLAAAAEVRVSVAAGETLFAICASGKESTLEVI
jgi:hypothetical protein